MATILLSAAGAAIGGSVGGTVMGLSMAAMGRFAGATVGRVIDQRLLGAGSDVVETGRVDRFRLSSSGEGDAISRVFGRMRVGGQVIWATHFAEHVSTSGGGKGGAPAPSTREFRYTVSLAIALCEGQIEGVGRIWADGSEISPADLTMRVYPGDDQQLPDPKMEAIEGAGAVPAYRGTAYVVFEDLDLSQFGNRVPQFSFEVLRADRVFVDTDQAEPARAVQGVALIPGTGEYALATQPAVVEYAMGSSKTVNANSPSGKTDFLTSMDQMEQELPACEAVSLVVSWFGDDLRCGSCQIRPMVEQSEFDAAAMPWQVSGLTRATVEVVPQLDDRAVYGGTPTDQSVIQAVAELAARGKRVMFYPFILMDQLEGNALPDPYGADEQAALPWRGRITAEVAPGLDGSPDGTSAADAQVAAFFGTASASDFTVAEGAVSYSGPDEWSYRRFILHNAALCAAAGGVSAFCIGSEMRGLTQLRGVAGFPAVQALRGLAAEVRQLLGAGVKLGYAADWSEYFGYHPQDGSGDVYFHLDPLWADEQIDFIGIDNYMPLTDWRDGDDHLDAGWGTIYDLDYLRAGVEGGEGYDWYYHSAQAEAAQIRTPITDAQEPWIWRYKDIRNWWQNDHHERISGVRQEAPTDWVPQSKPVWFTELGCAAIDKGSNQPNRFLDPKSSESGLPRHSSGRRDEYMQMQYLRAVLGYWGDPANNPVSVEYQGPMLDMANAYVWAWDARPYPHFPANTALWSDGANYARGHWLNGRGAARSLASVVREICEDADVSALDTSRLHGLVRGYLADSTDSARALLQPLMLCHGFDAVERDGVLVFRNRDGRADAVLEPLTLAVSGDTPHGVEHARTAESDLHGRVRLRFVAAGGDFEAAAEEAVLPDQADHSVSQSEMPILMTRSEGRQAVERWLSEARIGRDSVKLALAPSQSWLGAGDVVALGKALYRLDRVETGALLQAEGVRVDAETYRPTDLDDEPASVPGFAAPTSVFPLFLDLPLLSGDETPHAPHVAATANPWPGTVSVFSATQDSDYALLQTLGAPAVMGQLVAPLMAAPSGRFDRHGVIQVRLARGTLSGRSEIALLNGANVAAIGDGTPENWELVQFRDAQLVAQDTWHLSMLLRGQAGSDGLIPVTWPEGSYFVLLDGAAKQLDLPSSIRTVAQHYRIGPSLRAYDDPSYKHEVHAFSGVGLKPYAPAHLSKREYGGDMVISWIRRTRIDGDSWDAPEVPLGEEAEAYLLRVMQGNQVIREETLTVPNWTYSAAQQANDGLSGAYEIAVAQVSARYGPGHFARLSVSA
ncbi:host specificity protein [Thalassobius vesicularis]|uniref:Host specificity protein n=1 Tax=Thalassobius vesicularis TaxID=1294297 RepID=A0A4S3MAR9_9RHOB|nr:glycoside hydrolase/phage tail family protein [Thalassobius vesicularis]THD74653.1 host specificity protein [Thalassobius vesicularis]